MAGKTLSFSNIFLSNGRTTINSTRDQFSKFNWRERRFYKILPCFDPAQELLRNCASNFNRHAEPSRPCVVYRSFHEVAQCTEPRQFRTRK